mmetsp:Transcript_51634/g.102611  ORF Transcript_51634/g.102611 Transcript_51634/m.102611 type:complete len:278 (-) Transcript_51634:38-871(-)|eukprot:CAMPEP_0172708910 /NCGR_PEP_ID=MMETSP1074-20121228/52671_1 /TAXON_ID=2916 /ORGANISM="Ceratium fusus, Strain PA161109" /LENGTH=277 /DNA_ID=CAMNT_0013531995 /DNA_START=45 /DNA_END=878 /DNA_ORIENTATION=+
MAAAVAEPQQTRQGSRSPRRQLAQGETTLEQPEAIEIDEWEGLGPEPCNKLKTHFSIHKAFLSQFMQPRHDPPQQKTPIPEMAAGLSLEAAVVLLFAGPKASLWPWAGLPAHLACLAASLRLFCRLLPPGHGRQVDEGVCDELCARLATWSGQATDSGASVLEAANACGLVARAVPSPTESLRAMVNGRLVACCGILEAYVAVVDDPETGEELEQEVGAHAVLVVGGDLLSPNYVVFDPWGPRGGHVAYWSGHDATLASPIGWVELAPRMSPQQGAA